jgi:hypothetical protein
MVAALRSAWCGRPRRAHKGSDPVEILGMAAVGFVGAGLESTPAGLDAAMAVRTFSGPNPPATITGMPTHSMMRRSRSQLAIMIFWLVRVRIGSRFRRSS